MVGYAETAGQIPNFDVPPIQSEPPSPVYYCNINSFILADDECREAVRLALEEELPYQARYMDQQAPWSSPHSGFVQPGPARKFLGVYGLSVSGLSDSTREVGITEGILSGGVLGRERLAVPRFRFRVALFAVDEEGLEYGKSWLSKALSEQNCGTHGPSCGSSDLTFFAACPIYEREEGSAPESFDERMDMFTRMYHDVKCVAGPVTVETSRRPENTWMAIVEFDLAAGVPNLFGLPNAFIPISQDNETIIQDIPRNEIPYPSAEIAGADIVVATNYSLNPSVETNATGWAFGSDTVNITNAMLAAARVTGELQAVGTASYRVVFTATGAGTNGFFYAQQEVDLSARPAGSAVSVNIWAAQILVSGAPVRNPIAVRVYWRATSGGGPLGIDNLGTIPVNGGPLSKASLIPPAGANFALVRVESSLSSWPSGTVLRMYADALAVTVP